MKQFSEAAQLQVERAPAERTKVDIAVAIRRSHDFFERGQHQQGYWLAPLEADTTLESDYVLLLHLLGIADEVKTNKAIRYIRSRQLSGGGWNIYEGGPEEISATVKAYAALKLGGVAKEDPALVKTRVAIKRMGGITKINTFAKTYLSLIEQFPLEGTPAIPPEIILLPRWFPFNIYEISSWSRAILVPLSIIYATKPRASVPSHQGLSELFDGDPEIKDTRLSWSDNILSWRNFFLLVDRILKIWEQTPLKPLRRHALKRAERWVLDRLEGSAGLGAIYPAMVNSILALKSLGYPKDHYQMQRSLAELEKLIIEGPDTLQFQPCQSPVWDTGLTMLALLDSGMTKDHPCLVRSAGWLLSKQTNKPGDWSVKNPKTPPGGWYFEFANEFYPDLDDTCVALMVLRDVRYPDEKRNFEAQSRGLRWLMDMQSSDGGWASFDRNNNRSIFTQIPFADHNAMLDPSTADITGRVLEMLARYEYTPDLVSVRRALRFLRSTQEEDGSWFGRWGVNYVYGTWQVLKGLRAIGEDMEQPYIRKAKTWLEQHQNPDGGWGESCESYHDPQNRGNGTSTPSQTAWGVMGLMAAGDTGSLHLQKGMDCLLRTQTEAGDWPETEFTGTGFPGVFYLRYNHYRNYFPLIALGMYHKLLGFESQP